MFRRVAVFDGGCTLEAAEAVAASRPWTASRRSWTRVCSSGVTVPRRAALRACSRPFASMRWSSSNRVGDADRIATRTRAYSCALAEQAEPELIGRSRWSGSRGSTRSARTCARRWHGHFARVRPTRSACGWPALWRYWDSRGDLAEGERWLERALAAGGDVEPGDPRSSCSMSRACSRAGAATWNAPRRFSRKASRSARERATCRGIASALVNLGNIAFDLAQYERAASLYQESLELTAAWATATARRSPSTTWASRRASWANWNGRWRCTRRAWRCAASWATRRVPPRRSKTSGARRSSRATIARAAGLLREALLLWRELRDRSPIAADTGRHGPRRGDARREVRAARLWGAAESMRTRYGTPMPPHRRARYAAAVADARARLSAPLFEDAWAAGAALSTGRGHRLCARRRRHRPAPQAAHPLSPREQEVADLIARGLTSKEIAAQLVVSEKTVDTHADHIRQKLGLRSRAEIAIWVTTRGSSSGP